MEEDKKKKRNKKKKNKQQNKGTDDASSGNFHNTNTLQDLPNDADQNRQVQSVDTSQSQPTSSTDVQDNGLTIQITKSEGHHDSDINEYVIAESERQKWLLEEARLKEVIKQLHQVKDSHADKEAGLESKIVQLENERDSWHKKEANFEQEISQCLREKTSLCSEKASFEQKIGQLLQENAALSSKNASFEQNISQLLQENSALSSEKANLLDKVQDLDTERAGLLHKENSNKDMISILEEDNSRLKFQVLELEESKKNLLRENQQLTDDASLLQSRVQVLERSLSSVQQSADINKAREEDLHSQIESACALVEKLVIENAELVEKVNELYLELGRCRGNTGYCSPDMPDTLITSDDAADVDPRSEPNGGITSSTDSVKTSDVILIQDGKNVSGNVGFDYPAARHSSETGMSGEIVQIPLHENEVQDLEAQATAGMDSGGVSLADAPLIGAPFRLVSFVAKYVSGADLVDSPSNSGL